MCVWEREIVTELRFTQRVNFTSILFSIWFGISTCNLKWKTFEKIGNSFTYIFNHKPVVIFKVKSHTNSDFWLIEFYTVSTCGCMSFTEGSRFNVNFFCISLGILTWIWKGKSLTLQNVNSINCWRKWMSEWVLLTGGSEFHFFFCRWVDYWIWLFTVCTATRKFSFVNLSGNLKTLTMIAWLCYYHWLIWQ